MNILIIGANGLLGRNLVNILSKKERVFALVRNKNILNFEINENVEVIEMDLLNVDVSKLPNNIDSVYYLAQSKKFREFPERSEDVLMVNVVAPHKIVRWSIERGVKQFIYASTGGVYTKRDKPLKEYFKINANSRLDFYLSSKLSAEILLRSYSSFFKTFAIIRPFFIYGPGQDKEMLIPRLISKIKKGEEIYLNGRKGIKINPIYVTDAANAVANILNLEGEIIANIAGNEIVSIKQLCMIIGNIIDKKPVFTYVKEPSADLVGDISLMKQKLWIPKIDLFTGLSKLVSIY
jgi:nucleoside-diphosphate-sugar epimerase